MRLPTMRGQYPTWRELDQDLKKAATSFRRMGNPLESGEFRYMDMICKLKPSANQPEGEENKIVRVQRVQDGALFVLKILAMNLYKSQVVGELYPRQALPEKAHQHFVSLEALYVCENKIMLCMEYVPQDLDQLEEFWFQNKGTNLSEIVIGNIAKQILKGLFFLHQRHFIHRDIKPKNILFTRDCFAKIADFGQCIRMTSYKLERASHGTPFYSPPDSLYDEKEDIYCLGRSVLRLLLGKQAWIKLRTSSFILIAEKLKSKVSSECLQFLDDCFRSNDQRPSAKKLLKSPFVQSLKCEEALEEWATFKDEVSLQQRGSKVID